MTSFKKKVTRQKSNESSSESDEEDEDKESDENENLDYKNRIIIFASVVSSVQTNFYN
jgi:hypothetical protein